MKNSLSGLVKSLDVNRVRLSEPLSKYTTVGIGGPAKVLYSLNSNEELEEITKRCFSENIPLTVLGGGSNVLISDKGISGVVLINRSGSYRIGKTLKSLQKRDLPDSRWELDGKTVRYHFKDLDYDESGCDQVAVEVDSGVRLQPFIYEMIENKLTGLQWFSGIPGTIGGDVFNNLHGGTRFFSEVVDYVITMDRNGDQKRYTVKEIKPDYNYTIFHENEEVILKVGLNLFAGDNKRAKFVADEWRERKQKIQPQKSTGCIFANVSQEVRDRLDLPTTSVGHIVEHELGMSGYRVGNAVVSNLHHNFIVTEGPAKASDYLKIIKDITREAKNKLGIDLVTEILTFGFADEDLQGLNFPGM